VHSNGNHTSIELLRSRKSFLGRTVAHIVEPLLDHLQDRFTILETRMDEATRSNAASDRELGALLEAIGQQTKNTADLLRPSFDLATRLFEPHPSLPEATSPPYPDPTNPRSIAESLLQRCHELAADEALAREASAGGVNLWACMEEYAYRAVSVDAAERQRAGRS